MISTMKMAIFLLFGLLLVPGLTAFAQEETRFSVELSTDSVLLGNYFLVKFTLENGQGDNFVPPPFDDFKLMGGPNMSSSYSMMNGKITQSISYSFYLEPRDVGYFFIQPASIDVKDGVLETVPVEVLVVPNPDGVIQSPREDQPFLRFGPELLKEFPFPEKIPLDSIPPKKKRKTYKI